MRYFAFGWILLVGWLLSPVTYDHVKDWLENYFGPWSPTVTLATMSPPDTLKRAIPDEAEGAGALATWGSDSSACVRDTVIVLQVTSRSTGDGPGTLDSIADNVSAPGTLKVVVFNQVTGGYYVPNGQVKFDTDDDGCWIIAGQTAPGGGFALRGSLNFSRNNDHVIVTYLKFRANGGTITEPTAFSNIGGEHFYIAYNSFAYYDNDMVEIFSDTSNSDSDTLGFSTLAYNVVGPALRNGRGAGYRTDEDSSKFLFGTSPMDFHHNFLSHNLNRAPKMEAPRVRVINNISYNCEFQCYESENEGSTDELGTVIDWIGNIAKHGPRTKADSTRRGFTIDTLAVAPDSHKIYVEDNRYLPIWDPPDTQWVVVKHRTAGTVPDSNTYKQNTKLPATDWDITVHSSEKIRDSLRHWGVGMYRRLECDGTWTTEAATDTTVQDSIDIQLFLDYESGGGSDAAYDSIDEGGNTTPHGIPDLPPGDTCDDDDSDGMPNAWEATCGTDSLTYDAQGDISGDLRTNIEEYIWGTINNGWTVEWTDNSANEDGFIVQYARGSGWTTIDTTAPNIETFRWTGGLVDDSIRLIVFNADGENISSVLVVGCN